MIENILIVGGGGREHAIAKSISTTNHEINLFACSTNKNPGIFSLTKGYGLIDESNPLSVLNYAKKINATMVFVGPEKPLLNGVTDSLEQNEIFVFGPTKKDARIETDKSWQRTFMKENSIPGCPDFEIFSSSKTAINYLNSINWDVAVKPSGLTGGKGVVVTGDQVSKQDAIDYISNSGYDDWVIEERLIGEEITIQAFVSNGCLRFTPAVQDHKRAYEGDSGPNTGGMGSFSSASSILPFMTLDDYKSATEILSSTISALPSYRGILYGQFMLTEKGPKVVEFNARFGDPEAMNILPILKTDLVDILIASRNGSNLPDIEFYPHATVCKYVVPQGYPAKPISTPIKLPPKPIDANSFIFHSNLVEKDGELFTTSSRSFAVVGISSTISLAEKIAESHLTNVEIQGLRVRHDIGTKDLIDKRISNMDSIRQMRIS